MSDTSPLKRIVMRLARNPGAALSEPDDHRGYALVAPLDADDELFHRTNLRTLQNTLPGNFADLCGVSLPMGTGAAGMPLGALISGAAGRDAALLAAAAGVEQLLSAKDS